MEASIAKKEDENSRKERKIEGKRKKREKIEQSGGKRPRMAAEEQPHASKSNSHPGNKQPAKRSQQTRKGNSNDKSKETAHRFGRVMDQVPCPGKPRHSTLSIAVPGSIVSNAQTRELKTYLVSQIARAITIHHVDEIVVYDDKLSVDKRHSNHRYQYSSKHRNSHKNDEDATATTDDQKKSQVDRTSQSPSDPHVFMARILQYCECPQYLRRNFFPMHIDLQFAGLLPPIDAPHHVRAEDRSKYREGVVLEKCAKSGNSLVNCGIKNRPVEINIRLKPGVRCTVQLDSTAYSSSPSIQIQGTVVSPSTPRLEDGTYWGYTTRLASSIQKIFDECPFPGGYDLKIGTSERGSQTIESKSYSIPRFRHAIIVFGGVAGIEECVDADESLLLSGSKSHTMFDQWVNICPFQGSRTIRTEEAVMIALAKLGPWLTNRASEPEPVTQVSEKVTGGANNGRSGGPNIKVELSDDGVSEESSSEDEEN